MYYNLQSFLLKYFCVLRIFIFFTTVNCLEQDLTIGNRSRRCFRSKDLRGLTTFQLEDFYKSFDIVIINIDALEKSVLTSEKKRLEKLEILEKQEKYLKKRIFLFTKKSTPSVERRIQILKKEGYNTDESKIITPLAALHWHLDQIKFEGKAYVIGNEKFQETLTELYIDVVTGSSNFINEDIYLTDDVTMMDEDVKAVIVDFDVNINWAKMVKAGLYLRNKNITFLVTRSEKTLPEDKEIISPGFFVDILIEHSRRTPKRIDKLRDVLGEFLLERCSLNNSNKVLFIGDSDASDMKFADSHNFTKLLIGPEILLRYCLSKPTYYLPELSDMPICY